MIPKRHVEKPWELEDKEILSVYELINFVEQRVVKELATGVDLRQHCRPFLREGRTKVNHVHYHIFPRTLNDELHQHNTEDDLWEDLSPEEHDRIAKLLE